MNLPKPGISRAYQLAYSAYIAKLISMPVFEVTVEGRGILVPMGESEAVGFFRLLRIIANDQTAAEQAAMGQLQGEWQTLEIAKLNKGRSPMLRVDSVAELPWWHRFLPSRKGYIYFEKESEG